VQGGSTQGCYATNSAATLIYVTHILDEAQQVGGSFMRLNRGRLVDS
jgi:ABC-type uncharacterized transport system ATPase subunit